MWERDRHILRMPMAALTPFPPILTPTPERCRLSVAPRLGSKSQRPSDHYVLSPPGRSSVTKYRHLSSSPLLIIFSSLYFSQTWQGHEKNPPLPVHPLPPVLGKGLGKASAVAFLAASLFLAHPAVAFKVLLSSLPILSSPPLP